MIDSELSKELKKPPEIEFEIPKRILLKQEPGSKQADSLLVQMWDFS